MYFFKLNTFIKTVIKIIFVSNLFQVLPNLVILIWNSILIWNLLQNIKT